MSHKIAKRVRAAVKAQGLHPRAIKLMPMKPVVVGVTPMTPKGAV